MKITKKWIFIGLGLAFIVLSLGIYKTFKAVSEFYPAQIRNSQFHRIVIGMAKDEVLKILTDIPNASNSAQFPQANLKCQTNLKDSLNLKRVGLKIILLYFSTTMVSFATPIGFRN